MKKFICRNCDFVGEYHCECPKCFEVGMMEPETGIYVSVEDNY